jgi:tetratricopeptide (TPR) repeat protein
MGRVYETGIKDNTNAEKYYKQALQIKPDYVESMGNLGRVYYNQGVNKQSDANNIQDQAKYQVELAKAKEFFKQALPLFEQAHQAKPDEREYMTALRGIYYNLNMGDKLKAIEAEMNK